MSTIPTSTVRQTKLLRPQLGRAIVARPRLHERLNAGLANPLTLVSGPAGSGKTTLLCEWLASLSVPSAWLSLDEGDGDLSSFVEHVIAALQTIAPAVGRSTLGSLRMSETPSASDLATELGDDLLAVPGHLILVLDDYQRVEHPLVDEFLAALLRYPPPHFHIVVATRVDPVLPLAQLRAHGLLTEVRSADLRFADHETRALLRRALNQEPDLEVVDLLQQRTEGWVAGLRLATIALRDGDGLAALANAETSMLSFLADDVVDVQPAEVQRFLVRTAVPARLCPGLCDALLDEVADSETSQRMLEQLERAGLFIIPLGEDRAWYRYHHLFRELLLRRLVATEGNAEVRRLHGRASAWFANHHLVEEAISHALEAGDPTVAADLVGRHVQRALAERRWLALERWLGLLPPELVQGRADLLLAQGWVQQLRGQYGALATTLDRVDALLNRLVDQIVGTVNPASVERWQAEVNLMRAAFVPAPTASPDTLRVAATRAGELLLWETYAAATVALYYMAMTQQAVGDLDGAIHLLTEALAECAGRSDPFSLHRAQGAAIALMVACMNAGDLARCRRTAEELLALATAHGVGWSAAAAHVYLGLVDYEQDRLDAAIGHLAEAVDEPEAGSLTLHTAHQALALALQMAGRPAEADATVNRLLDRLLATADTTLNPTIRSFQARLAVARGDTAAAEQWLRTNRVSAGGVSPHAFEEPRLTRVKVLLALGGPAPELATTDEAFDALARHAEVIHAMRRRIDLLAHLALIQRARGRMDVALETIAKALALAEPRGFFRVFVDLGEQMEALLALHLREATPSPLAAQIITAIQASLTARATERSPSGRIVNAELADATSVFDVPLAEHLTDRELDVLDRLAKRLTNKEIADELSISPFTVKRHTANIYSKLGVSGRRQAIRQARAAGLVPFD